MTDVIAEIRSVAAEVENVLPHRFELITELGDGTRIPPEALSEDHTIGLYGSVIPRKMRESVQGFREIEVADLTLQQTAADMPSGRQLEWSLEYQPLRNVRFRAEKLQYLEEGWWAVTAEVVYPAAAVLGLLHVVKTRYGAARIYINAELPMPLLIRSAPLARESDAVQAVVQARGEGRVLFTNIHTECPMEYARQWAEAARGYYRTAEA